MIDGNKGKRATPHGTLLEQLLNPNFPKSEREWAASREIEKLYARTVALEKQQVNGCPCLYTSPCDQQCTCVEGYFSRGCERCARYGSEEQRKLRAEDLALLPVRIAVLEAAIKLVSDDIGFFGFNDQHEPAFFLNLNDTFSYSTADCLEVPWERIHDLAEKVKAEGWPAAIRYAAEELKLTPLEAPPERVEIWASLKMENSKLRTALDQYMNEENWETLFKKSGEDRIVWMGEGDHGYTIAQEVLKP